MGVIGPPIGDFFRIQRPTVDVDVPLQMLVTTLDYDTYRGLTAIGRVFAVRLVVGQAVARLRAAMVRSPSRALKATN